VIIGITGNVGKTTTRNILSAFLSEYTLVGTNRENYNTDLGVCLSVLGATNPRKNLIKWIQLFWKGWRMTLQLPDDFPSVWVLELGIDKPGDMDFFVDNFLQFDIVIFGYVGEYPVHAQNFGGRDLLIHEKSKILRGLKPEGTLIINGDDPFIEHLYHKRSNVITVGFNESNHLQAQEFHSHIRIDDSPSQWEKNNSSLIPHAWFKVRYKGSIVPCKFDYLFAKEQTYNILSVIAVGLYDQLNLVEIMSKINHFSPIPGRLRFLEGIKNSLLIDDSYNAAPAAVISALDALDSIRIPGVRKIAAIGELKELGDVNDQVHRMIGNKASETVDIFIGVGESLREPVREFQANCPGKQAEWFLDSQSAAEWLISRITSDDIILVKGSQSSRMERISSEILANKRYRSDVLPRQTSEWLSKV
jgi:UDP-N-acetylmuramoyl-tripeptide--D-alanyl-D-alanine ligase